MRFGLEASAGYRLLKGVHTDYEFRTSVYPISLSFTIEFYSAAALRPFVSVGAGALPYNLEVLKSSLQGQRREQGIAPESGVAFWMPLRAGLRFAISPALDLHVSFERSVSLSDRIDGIVTKDLDWMNDNFESLMLGFTWYFLGEKSSDPYGRIVFALPDPPKPDKPADSDGDGLSDNDELHDHKTDPFSKDTDGDGLSDGDEVLLYQSKPLLADSDGDGLPDGREVALGTSLNNRDTDGDGFSDSADDCPTKAETVNGYRDEDGCPDEAERGEFIFTRLGEVLILENIEFETGKAILLPRSYETLDKITRSLTVNPKVHIEVRGHTDSTGSNEANMLLSLRRAESIRNYLVSKGIENSRITVLGLGPSQPISPNDTPAGRQRNRRIEFRITKTGE